MPIQHTEDVGFTRGKCIQSFAFIFNNRPKLPKPAKLSIQITDLFACHVMPRHEREGLT
jgi:hypothetical protein